MLVLRKYKRSIAGDVYLHNWKSTWNENNIYDAARMKLEYIFIWEYHNMSFWSVCAVILEHHIVYPIITVIYNVKFGIVPFATLDAKLIKSLANFQDFFFIPVLLVMNKIKY